jgi:serine/threonine protein kinase
MLKIQSCNYQFGEKDFENVSKEAQDWIEKLLELNPEERMTPKEAKAHKWLSPLANDKDRKRY